MARTRTRQSRNRHRRRRILIPYHVYDEYGYRIFSDPETARAFLVYFLRKYGYLELAEMLEGATLTLMPTRHAKSGLRSGHSDVWFEVAIGGKCQCKLRIQIEIKGVKDPRSPLQIGINCLEDALQELKSGAAPAGRLTQRISLLVNLGPRRWRGPNSIEGMFSGDGRLRKLLKDLPLRGRFPPVDLMALDLDELLSIPHRRLAVYLSVVRCANDQKRYGEDDLVRALRLGDSSNSEEISDLALLLARLHNEDRHGMLRRALERAGIGGEAMDSIEQAAEKRGKAETFLVFARQKFRRVPKKREAQVRSATAEQIDEWTVRAVDAPDLGAVFNGSAVNGHVPSRKKLHG